MNKLIPAICKKVAGIFNFKLCQNNQQTLKDGASSITIDAATDTVERVNFGYENASFGSKTDHWLATLHMGHISLGKDEQICHSLYQLFLVLVGLAVTILSGTGAYLWWRGRQGRLKQRQKLTVNIVFNIV